MSSHRKGYQNGRRGRRRNGNRSYRTPAGKKRGRRNGSRF